MSAIFCSCLEDIPSILSCYHECKRIGLQPMLLVRQELQSTSFSSQLSGKLQGQIDIVMIPEKTEEIHSSFFSTRSLIITFRDEVIKVPHPYHQLRIQPKQYILSIATITGFAQVKTFGNSSGVESFTFPDELCRELLGLTAPTFITLFDKQSFIWKGGLTQPNSLNLRQEKTLPATVTGVPVKIRILPLTNWTTTDHLIQEWSRFCEGSSIELVNENPDYFLVINSTSATIDPARTLYFMMEPYGERLYADWFRQYPGLYFNGSHRYHLNNVEWHLRYSTPQLRSINMDTNSRIKGLCAIVSSKQQDPGQKYRLELIRALDRMLLPFPFHIYGQCSELGFRNYRGEIPRIQKETVLEQYQYNLICENNDIRNYVTEKLYDGILCESFTFYKGAPNVHSFFVPSSFGLLKGDLSYDIQFIIESIQSDAYRHCLPKIKEMKTRLLTQWSLPVRLNSILELGEALVLVRYPDQHTVVSHHQAIEKLLVDQSFHYTARGVFEKDNKWLQQVVQTGLQQEKSILVIDHPLVTDQLFQTLTNVVHLQEVDVFTLHPDIQSGIQYFRLKGAEKIMLNLMNNQPPLTGITKCIFTV